MKTSNKKLASGFLWNFGEKLLIQLITFVVGIILARKLGPATYGLVATVSTIITILTVATNLYTGTYLMRKKEVDSLDMNTAFFFGLVVHLILYLILFFVAPFLADLYNSPEITPLLRVMGISILFSSFMGIKLVTIVRNYQYRKFFFISFIGTFVAGVSGIVLAYTGFGPWALVAQHGLDCVIDTIFLWIFVRWAPKLEFSFKRLKEMLKYGLPLWLFGIADSASTKVQALIIGKQYSSADLAYYNRGESFPLIIESNSTSALNNVLLRRVSEEQDDLKSVQEILEKITRVSLYIAFPAMLGLAAVSHTLIYLLLGSDWLPSVMFVDIFCISFMFKPIEITSDIALKATGKTKTFFAFGIIKKLLFIISIIISVPFGVKAIAVGFMIASICAAFVSMLANQIVFKIHFASQLGCLITPFIISGIMWILVNRIGTLFPSVPSPVILIIQILIGIAFYLFLLVAIDNKSWKYFIGLVKSIFHRKKSQ